MFATAVVIKKGNYTKYYVCSIFRNDVDFGFVVVCCYNTISLFACFFVLSLHYSLY